MLITLLCILCALLLIAAVIYLCLAAKYPHVSRGLRFPGWLISAVTSYDSVEGLLRFAHLASKFRPPLLHHKAVDIQKFTISGRDEKPVPLVIYRPEKAGSSATGLLWIHGGGYAIGCPEGELRFLKPLILETGTVVVSPDYRHSDAAPYPAAFHDCLDTLLWMQAHADQLGINKNQIFVGGASAGGGLAAALALYARDSRSVQIAFQLPIYPMINDRMDTPSMAGNREMLWDEGRNRAAWQLYLGSLYGTEDVPVYAAPARESDYSGLPPAYTFVGTLDPFYDETLQYMQALQKNGIPAEYDIWEGAFHGFDVIPSKISGEARKKLLTAYKYAVTHYFAEQP